MALFCWFDKEIIIWDMRLFLRFSIFIFKMKARLKAEAKVL